MRRVCLALGVLLLLAAAALTGYNLWDANRADEAAQTAVRSLEAVIADDPAPNDVPGEMPRVTIDGRDYLGVLSIPSQGLELPVLADWDFDALRLSPCRYAGSYFTGDLVIAGHNYAKHFSPLKWIEPDTEIVFTAADGAVLRYRVLRVDTLQPPQIEEMTVPDGWDLTLFTCTTGGRSRCAVRCERIL